MATPAVILDRRRGSKGCSFIAVPVAAIASIDMPAFLLTLTIPKSLAARVRKNVSAHEQPVIDYQHDRSRDASGAFAFLSPCPASGAR
jgi:hypothetical protein